MLMAQKQSNAEQIDEHSRQSRSPSVDSVSRLHQQSGGFASQNQQSGHQSSQQGQLHQRRGSVSNDGNSGYYSQHNHNSSGYRKQSFSQRGNRGMNQRSGNNYQQNADNLGTNFQQGYQSKQQRSYQNYSQHNSKYSYYYHPRPIFNSTQEYGAFSVRRQSPSSPSSPTPPTNSSTSRSTNPAPILLRHVEPTQNDKMFSGSSEQEQQHHEAKIHQYRSAGTAPGGYSNSSSPYKQQTLHQPTTPVASDKRNDTDDWASRFQHPPPGIQYQFRRTDNVQAPIELQRKSQAPSAPIDIVSNSLPTTPSPSERNSQYRAPLKDSQLTDNVDAKHPCFADERMHSALYGVSPQMKSQHQPSGLPIQNEREASASMEALKALQYQQQWQHHMTRGVFLPQFVYTTIDNQMRQLKNRDHQSQHQHSQLQRVPSFDGEFSAGKELRKRDSSNDSQCSSEANPNDIPQMMEKLDADLDKTPVVDEEGIRKSRKNVANSGRKDHRKMNEFPRKTNRRDSICSNASSASDVCSPVLDESTLTKVYPNEEFRGGPGVASPSPPAALLSEPLSRMDVLSEKIWDYHNKVSQTDEMLQRKLHLRDMLYTAISPVFPLSGLYVVGSSLNGFGNNSSDMDLCLMITNKDLDQKNDAVVVLNLILSTLQYEKFVASQKLILAKVPILRIKFAAPFDDITVDLNANNSVAIRNTHLLCYYSSYDWRVRPLVSVVKEWAKRKGINDANKSSFTSYSLVLMVIHYLQCGTEARVLPNLQQSYPTRFSNKVDVRTLNVTMPLEPVQDDIDPSLSENTTLGELLIGFLDYYANEFNYDRDAISIRQGKRVERAALAVRPKVHLSSEGEKEAPLPSSSASSSSVHNGIGVPMHHSLSNPHFWRSQWRCVCIEEPFTNSNTAHSIYDEMVFGAIKEAFREAHSELQDNRDLDRLLECEPIKASTTNAGAAVFAATYEGERPSAQQPTSIASASLRTMNLIPTPAGGGHYHYQQQSSQQVLKQQRSGNNQSYSSSNNRSSNNNQQQNRRVYNSQSAFNGSGSRPSKSSDSLKDSTSNSQQSHRQHHHNQRSNAGSTKENIALTSGATSSTDRKNSTSKKDEGSRTKRSSMIQSPEPTKAKTEKTATTQKKESQ